MFSIKIKYKVFIPFLSLFLLTAFSFNLLQQVVCFCGSEQCSVLKITPNHHLHKNNFKKSTKHCCSKKNKTNNHKNDNQCACEKININLISEKPKVLSSHFKINTKIFNTTLFNATWVALKIEICPTHFFPVNYKHPPPKIPDIRVFIQSFTL